MNKLLAGAATVAGLLLSMGQAHAFTLTVNVPQNPPSPASGSYTVVLSSTDNVNYSVTAFGNNDGNGSSGNPSGTPAKHSAGTLSLTFFDASMGYVRPVTGSGATTTGAGFTGANWVALMGDNLRFLSPNQTNDLAPYGGNTFNGSFSLQNANALSVDIAMQDGSQQWFAPGNAIPNTPEPASLAMVLPGVLPLGLVLRRRRRKAA
jgi:hypothetical protein